MEVKTLLEIRTAKLAMTGDKIGGYASVYDAPSHPLTFRGINGGKPFTERVARGAFDSSLGSNISLLVGHDSRDLLANTKSGLLQLRSDDHGLAFEVTLPANNQRAQDVRSLVDAGVLSEMSFGFQIIADSWVGNTRTLQKVSLREISIVSEGAYPQTLAEARHLQPGLARLRLRLRMPS
jgi:HK97 family phage prohead protease